MTAHRQAMTAAQRRAGPEGWLSTPELPMDYRGPLDWPYLPWGEAGAARPLLEALREAMQRAPDSLACEDAEGRLSFTELWQAVARLARAIAATPAPVVAIFAPGGRGCLAAILACLAAGRIGAVLDARVPEARRALLLRLTGAGLVLAPEATAAAIAAAHAVPALPLEAGLAGPPAVMPPPVAWRDPLAPAVILATSGSTGEPKLIAIAERGLGFRLATRIDEWHIGPADRVLVVSPASSIGGLKALLYALTGAAVRVEALGPGGLRPMLAAMAKWRPTILRLVPSLLRSLVAQPGAAAGLASLRLVCCGGEPLLRADIPLFRRALPPGCLIANAYGSTEAEGIVWFADEADAHDPVRIAAGRLVGDVEVRIAGEDGRPCPPGEVGELQFRSHWLALGEWREGVLVPGRLRPDPTDPTRRIYASGDMARLDADGVVVVLGRRDRMVKLNGLRVELGEIETALLAEAGVAEACVVARQAEGRVLVRGFVVGAATVPDLRAALRSRLPAYMQPGTLQVLDALPRLSGGKLDQGALLDWPLPG